MGDIVNISDIKDAIFTLREKIADINGEYPMDSGIYESYLWKGLKFQRHKTKKTTRILVSIANDYVKIQEHRYTLLLIRNDLLEHHTAMSVELSKNLKKFKSSDERL